MTRKRLSGWLTGVAAAATTLALATGTASAFPRFSDCPLRGSTAGTCVDIESPSGSIDIKGFNVPLHNALEIRGGVRLNADGSSVFVPPAGTNGFFATGVAVPGGLLGIDLPISANMVTATAQLAGASSDIRVDLGDLSVTVPIKLKLSNIFLSSSCTIGTNSNPVRLRLIVGTTNPPAPNRPISGRVGTISFPGGQYLLISGNTNVDNSFSIPAANNCGIFSGGLIDSLINLKLKLPSAGGNNTMIINNNVATQAPQ